MGTTEVPDGSRFRPKIIRVRAAQAWAAASVLGFSAGDTLAADAIRDAIIDECEHLDYFVISIQQTVVYQYRTVLRGKSKALHQVDKNGANQWVTIREVDVTHATAKSVWEPDFHGVREFVSRTRSNAKEQSRDFLDALFERVHKELLD